MSDQNLVAERISWLTVTQVMSFLLVSLPAYVWANQHASPDVAEAAQVSVNLLLILFIAQTMTHFLRYNQVFRDGVGWVLDIFNREESEVSE